MFLSSLCTENNYETNLIQNGCGEEVEVSCPGKELNCQIKRKLHTQKVFHLIILISFQCFFSRIYNKVPIFNTKLMNENIYNDI